MPAPPHTSSLRTWMWAGLLVALIALRLPSLVQPPGGDQWLYSYVGQRVLEGDVPYRDAFEQKPPAIFFVYALLWRVWPYESVVAAGDLLAAALTAGLLVAAGRRMFGGRAGELSAAVFLLLGDPGIQRLAGLHVRAQCETFIALAVTAAIVAAGRQGRGRTALVAAGASCGLAFWLKYNAIVYVAPVALAVLWRPGASAASRIRDLAAAAAGAAAVSAAVLAYFAAAGALTDLWLGTIAYNLRYSGETYRGLRHAIEYVLTLPARHAFVDGLWFVGGLGALLAVVRAPRDRAVWMALAWLAAAVASIAINGARGLPQYFLQAAPALALATGAGFTLAWRTRQASASGPVVLAVAGVVLVAGLWRVGIEPATGWQPRLFGLPQAVSNLAHDLHHGFGDLSRDDYLRRFEREEVGKFSPLAVDRLARRARETTPEGAAIYVFGFASGGVYVKSGRPSASRFFWSRPVVLDFERTRPGFGPTGLLHDLERRPPALVALQKRDWGLAEPDVLDSEVFFMSTPALATWLEAGYEPDYQDAAFVVWRRRSAP